MRLETQFIGAQQILRVRPRPRQITQLIGKPREHPGQGLPWHRSSLAQKIHESLKTKFVHKGAGTEQTVLPARAINCAEFNEGRGVLVHE